MSEKILKATHDGELKVGLLSIPCYVLQDGTRVLTQRGVQTTIGMSTSGGASGAHRTASVLKGIEDKLNVSNDLSVRMSNPLIFRPQRGRTAYGYDATALIDICELILQARDKGNILLASQEKYADVANIIMRTFAKIGIIAVIDEVTGYQELRDKKALQAILDKYLRKEYAAWAKRFPDEFYQEMFRLKGWQWRGMKVNRPSVVGHYTNDIVYQRLAPELLAKLQELNPKDDKGHRQSKHHQWLTDDIGIPELGQHLYAATSLMKASTSWDRFHRALQRAFPKLGTNLELPIEDVE